jgi:glycosyltransferase involved in cell wall biosynthesis
MQIVDVAVIVAVRNEAANIGKCLRSLVPAREIFVIDSGSDDATAEIAREAGATVVQFSYHGGYPKKRQWAIDTLPIRSEWLLMVDADEEIPEALWQEIAAATAAPAGRAAFLVRKGFWFLGRRFRFGGFSFQAVLLFRKGMARFERLVEDAAAAGAMDMEVHERVLVDGPIGTLRTPLIHDDFKGLAAYIDRHNRYSTWEARHRLHFLKTGQWGNESIRPRLFGNAQERRRFLKFIAVRVPGEATLWFLYHYVVRGGFLEGYPGYVASRIRANYIADVRAKVYELVQGERADDRENCDGSRVDD